MNMPQTKIVCTRLSIEQCDILDSLLDDSQSRGDYLRDLIAQDMQQRGVGWPDYEIVTNEDRATRGIKGRGLNYKGM